MRCVCLLLLATLLCGCRARQQTACPITGDIRPCTCHSQHQAVFVTCENAGASQLHNALVTMARWRGSIERLTLRHNRLGQLSHRLFNGISVFQLDIVDNGVTMLDRGAFHGLERSLTRLLLSEPRVEKIAFDAFDDLSQLESLHIDRTPLQTMPSLARVERLRVLRINGTGIRQIPARAFRGVPELRELHFTYNPTAAIGEHSLLGLGMLRLVNFSYNDIERIHPRAFFPTQRLYHVSFKGNGVRDAALVTIAAREAKSLRRLDVSGNLIEYVKTGTFVDLKNLEILDLRENFITKIDQDAFHVLPSLKRLDLTNNYVNSLKKGVFFSMDNLEQLLLRQNNITKLDGTSAVLRMLPKLRLLDLSMNLIDDIPSDTFSHPSLEILYLDHNNVKRVDRNGFKNLPELRELHLHHNFLVMEAGSDWWQLPQLTLLDLSYNDMTQLHASILRNVSQLEHADFSYNIISVVNEDAFQGTPILKHLNLSFNSLPTIYPATFKGLTQLRQVDLSYNELVLIESGHFSEMEMLEELRMKFNKIALMRPNSMPSGTVLRHLDLSYNFLESFPAAALFEVRGLESLRIKQNMLRDLPAKSLQKLTKLRELDFGFNTLPKLDPGILRTMIELRSVDLSGNYLTTVPIELFENNRELRTVNISNNLLTSIPPKTFHSLGHLETLDLKNNTLAEFDNMVNQLPSLRHLDASFNNIRFLSSTTFENTPSLERLEMHHNYVERINSNTFLNMPSLKYLDLSFNALVEMESGSFRGNRNLKAIALNNNVLRNLRESTFVNLNGLQRLDLQENKLTRISNEAYENLPALKVYNLSANQLPSLSTEPFRRLPSLQRLDLDHNRILEINDDAFRKLADLRMLKLNNNGMCRIHDDAFSDQRRLDTVHLENNRIRHLRQPLFRRLTSVLQQMDVSGNPLKCDCEIQWLRDWLGDLRARHPPSARQLGEPICFYPEEMRGIPMLRTRENDFHCERMSEDRTEPCPEFSDSELRVFQPPARPAGARKPHQLGFDQTGFQSVNDYDIALDATNEVGGPASPQPTTERSAPTAEAQTTAQIPPPTATTPQAAAAAQLSAGTQDSDFTAGDTPTIYVGSVKRSNLTQKQTGGGGGLAAGLSAAGGLLGTLGTLGTLSALLPKLGLTFALGGSGRNPDRVSAAPYGGGTHDSLPPRFAHGKPMRGPDLQAGTRFPGAPQSRPPGRQPAPTLLPPGVGPDKLGHLPTERPAVQRLPPNQLFVPAKHGHIRYNDAADQYDLNAYVFPDPQLNPGVASSFNTVVFQGEERPPAGGGGHGQRQDEYGQGQDNEHGLGQNGRYGQGQSGAYAQKQNNGAGQGQHPGYAPDATSYGFGAAHVARLPKPPPAIQMDPMFVPSPPFDPASLTPLADREPAGTITGKAGAAHVGESFGLQDVLHSRPAAAPPSAGQVSIDALLDEIRALEQESATTESTVTQASGSSITTQGHPFPKPAGHESASWPEGSVSQQPRPDGPQLDHEVNPADNVAEQRFPADELADFSLERLLNMIAEETNQHAADQSAGSSEHAGAIAGYRDDTSTVSPDPADAMEAHRTVGPLQAHTEWYDAIEQAETTTEVRQQWYEAAEVTDEIAGAEPDRQTEATERFDTTEHQIEPVDTTGRVDTTQRQSVSQTAWYGGAPSTGPPATESTPELDTFAPDHNWKTPENATFEARLRTELAVQKEATTTLPPPPPPPERRADAPRGRPSITKVQAYDTLPQFIAPAGGGPAAAPAGARLPPPEPASAPESNTVPLGDSLALPASVRGRSRAPADTANDWYYRNYFADELDLAGTGRAPWPQVPDARGAGGRCWPVWQLVVVLAAAAAARALHPHR